MIEASGGFGFKQKPLYRVVLPRPLGMDNLQRHLPTQHGIPGQIDLGHATGTQGSDDPIVIDHVLGLEAWFSRSCTRRVFRPIFGRLLTMAPAL